MSVYKIQKYDNTKCASLYFFDSDVPTTYTSVLNTRIFEWFSTIFDFYVDFNDLDQDEKIFIYKTCVRCFRDLLYLKIRSFDNYITPSSLKLLSFDAGSMALKYVIGYDWMFNEDTIIQDLMIQSNLSKKQLIRCEFDLLPHLLKLKSIRRVYFKR